MVLKLVSTNPVRRRLVRQLHKLYRRDNKAIWKRVAQELARPRRRRRAVNLSRINRYVKDNEVAIVPGKVLGAGKLEKPLTIIAESFSTAALEKIVEAGGRAVTLRELVEDEGLLKTIKSNRLVLVG